MLVGICATAFSLHMVQAQTPEKADIGIAYRSPPTLPPMNHLVLQAISAMPNGGGYATSRKAHSALKAAIILNPNNAGPFNIDAVEAKPSFCSGATYLVLLKIFQHLETTSQIVITPASQKALAEIGCADGVGIWGRWNANGPGTAKLFIETGCGTNFEDFSKALPGDFMKIWWTTSIGASESGHSVIYLGTTQTREGTMLRIWSSNIPDGYGEKVVPIARVKRALFSRLDKPERLANLETLPRNNSFLGDMVKRAGTWEEVVRECKCDVSPSPSVGPVPVIEHKTF